MFVLLSTNFIIVTWVCLLMRCEAVLWRVLTEKLIMRLASKDEICNKLLIDLSAYNQSSIAPTHHTSCGIKRAHIRLECVKCWAQSAASKVVCSWLFSHFRGYLVMENIR